MVLPYCEDFFLDWMLADKDNWVPTSAFPLPFFDSQLSEAERKLFKRNAEIQSNSSDENGRHGHESDPHSQASQGPSKVQKHSHFGHVNSYESRSPTQESDHDLLQPRRSCSELIFSNSSSKPPRSTSSDYLNVQPSVPKPPRTFSRAHLSARFSDPVPSTGSTAHALTSPLIRKESLPLLDYDEFHEEEVWGSAGDSESGISSMAIDSRSKDYSSHSEGSASESDVQFLATQVFMHK